MDWTHGSSRGRAAQDGQISLTKRLDQWAAHPFWGLVILTGILGLVFWLTFTVGSPIQNWLDTQVVGGYQTC